MPKTTIQDRAAGAIMGAFIGDALGLGPHWYYDLAELRRDYGEWITDYTDPKPGRYHEGLKAGQLSQAGFILALTLRSLVERGGYDEADFCRRMDEELFPLLDGTPVNGPGGYTSQSIREAWRRRVQQKLPWGQTGGHADDTEAIERTLALAVRYALHPGRLAAAVAGNTVLTQTDDTIVSMTVAFCAVLGLLVQGNALDAELSNKLMALVKTGELPFHTVTRAEFPAAPPRRSRPAARRPIRLAGCPAHAVLHGQGGGGSGYPHRAGVEGVHRLRHALRHLPPAPRRLLPRRPLPRRFRIRRAPRRQRRRPKPGARHPHRRPRRRPDRPLRHPAAIPRRTRRLRPRSAIWPSTSPRR